MINYNDGQWHGWNGGECPVSAKAKVKWATDDGFYGESIAEKLDWSQGTNICAFRVTRHAPRELWLVMSLSGYFLDAFDDKDAAALAAKDARGRTVIHVREVQE